MATRRRPQSRQRSSRRAASSSSSQQAIYVGVGAVVVLALVIAFVSSGNGKTESPGTGGNAAAPKASTERSNPRGPKPAIAKPGGLPGKTPDRPAPELTDEILAKLDECLREATKKYNDSVRARHKGDNSGARKAAGEARVFLQQWRATVDDHLTWQEYADDGDWAQPAAYGILTRKFQAYATLNKKVRMGGG